MQQVVNIEAEFFEIARQLSGAVDVAADHMERRNASLFQHLLRNPPRHFVEVRSHQDQRMLIEHGAASGVVLDGEVQMLQKTAVAASHVADALRLLVDRAVEDLDDDLVDFLEVGFVSAAAAPHVHAAVDHEFDSVVVETRSSRIAKHRVCAAR